MSLRIGSKTARQAAQSLAEQGLHLPTKPDEETIPFIPRDLTSVDDADLMELFSELTAWCDFATTQLALAQVTEREAERAHSRVEAKYMTAASANAARGDRVTALKAQVAANPEVVRSAVTVDEAYAYRKVVESLYTNLERDIQLISRELTRRTQSSPTSYRKRAMTA